MSLQNKLNRFKSHLIHDAKQSDKHQKEKVDVKSDTCPYSEKWMQENATPYFYNNEYCYIRESYYSLDEQHGEYRFSDLFTAVNSWQSNECHHPLSAKGLKANDLFFFDTETTGLYGGAGSTIFLLGYGKIEENAIVIRQHFLPEPGNEVALYKSFLENVDYTTLVTYNGKAFDWPRVKTQHTLVKKHVPKLPSFGHFDLYHASRRLWKDMLDSVKLTNVEKDILNIHRKDDVPGFLAPMIYFDYVDRKNPDGVFQVIKHNEMDILSLITLYIHISFMINGLNKNQSPKENTLIGKWFQYIGEPERAATHFESAAKLGDITAMFQLAYYQKRLKKYDAAKDLWLIVTNKGNELERYQSFIELAKLKEHQYKDIKAAIEYTEKALLLAEKISTSEQKANHEAGNKRLERLNGKLSSSF